MNKIIETCKNLKRTIDSMEKSPVALGNSTLRDNNIFATHRPSKQLLKSKLKSIMKKNNITDDQIR